MNKVQHFSLFSDFDIELFSAGKHYKLYNKLGSHLVECNGEQGVYFAVYAPGAKEVSVMGNFNFWNGYEHKLSVRWDGSGIWEGFISGLKHGDLYKYRILSHHDDKVREKTDPYARKYEMPPKTASCIWDAQYDWQDQEWMASRANKNSLDQPMSIYEIHLGSWKKKEGDFRSLHYTELAEDLVQYLQEMGYTHVEMMPITEHPFFPSWGYLSTGYFAPTSRYGDPEEFKYLVDRLHQASIGVYLDWVPAHFPSDEYALADFDGTCLYEHPDRKKGFHPDWNSLIFNFERPEICAFLISSAHFWLEHFHIDGLRVDAVASMLYLDYSREEGQWEPNQYGGNEYLAAIDLLKELNLSVYKDFPDIQMMAEESTAFSGVTRPVDLGGLGFGLKWMMGWMNDSLEYFSLDPIYRKYHHGDISRSLTYAFSENYILPLSHDEVVHGKNSIPYKMPGDEWQRFAHTRLLYIYMFTHPGQKLLFMGLDIGQTEEWKVNESISWHLLDFAPHKGLQEFIKALNKTYTSTPALYEINYAMEGFEWIDYQDHENSILAYIRKGKEGYVIIVCNFTPRAMEDYRIGVPELVSYSSLLNSDDDIFWGSGITIETVEAEEIGQHGRDYSISIPIPALGAIILKPEKTK
jgi:1,4-alpha-glucan branching enzyme